MFTKKLKKAVKETKKATEDVKKVVRKAKKLEDKKPEVKKEEKVIDHTTDLKDAVETALKLKGVRGYILLVDAQTKDEEDKTHGTGLKAICGSGDILANLIANIDPEVMNIYKKKEELKKLMTEGMDNIDDILKEIIKFAKNN